MNRADFRPPLWLRNPHVQSVLASVPPRSEIVRRRARAFRAAAEPVIVDCGAGVRLLGSLNKPTTESNGQLVVMIHGWEGSAESTYMLSVAPRLSGLGYSIFRLNLRDHGHSHHLNEDLFHSCRLDEVVGAVGWIQDSYPAHSIALAGFSLGGNFVLRVAAEAVSAGLSIARAVAFCPVLNPAQTMIALDRGWSAYHDYFIRRWRSSLLKKQQAFPDRYRFGSLSGFNGLIDMTEYFVEQHTEYPDLYSYLNGYALTGERLAGLQVPSFVLLAEDDPVIPFEGLADMQIPPAMQIWLSRYGGHCGFLQSLRGASWMDDFLLEKLEAQIPADSQG